jgi:hypothetical protein
LAQQRGLQLFVVDSHGMPAAAGVNCWPPHSFLKSSGTVRVVPILRAHDRKFNYSLVIV